MVNFQINTVYRCKTIEKNPDFLFTEYEKTYKFSQM